MTTPAYTGTERRSAVKVYTGPDRRGVKDALADLPWAGSTDPRWLTGDPKALRVNIPMTVSELIRQLNLWNKDADVWVGGPGDSSYNIAAVEPTPSGAPNNQRIVYIRATAEKALDPRVYVWGPTAVDRRFGHPDTRAPGPTPERRGKGTAWDGKTWDGKNTRANGTDWRSVKTDRRGTPAVIEPPPAPGPVTIKP